jgi:hypothetical protein
VNAAAFRDEGGTSLGPAWSRFDDAPFGGTADFVQQTGADASAYLETTFQDPTGSATPARLVQGTIQTRSLAGAGPNSFAWKTLPGTTVEAGAATAFAGDITGTSAAYRQFSLPTPAAGWTFAELVGLRFHTGYAGDVTPVPVVDAQLAEVEYRE